MLRYALILIGIVFLFSSCFKEDDPIEPHPKPVLEQVVIPLTNNYVNQVYFNLSSGEQVSFNIKNDFDLSFSCADTGYMINLNTATFMTAAQTGFSDLEQVTDTSGLVWHFDKSDGNPDSTAFFNWISIDDDDTTYLDKVWVINRGIDTSGFYLGLKKAKFEKLSEGKYYFTYADMDNSNIQHIVIEKNDGYNAIQFSFENNGAVAQIEPETTDWDLIFTQYTTLLFTDEGESYPYLVTGTLINRLGTRIAFDSTMVFSDIVLEDVIYLDYSDGLDAIGYEWKELFGDINGGNFYYQAKSNYNYFIKSKQGLFYKLRFTGFYNVDSGLKGYPTFEYQRL